MESSREEKEVKMQIHQIPTSLNHQKRSGLDSSDSEKQQKRDNESKSEEHREQLDTQQLQNEERQREHSDTQDLQNEEQLRHQLNTQQLQNEEQLRHQFETQELQNADQQRQQLDTQQLQNEGRQREQLDTQQLKNARKTEKTTNDHKKENGGGVMGPRERLKRHRTEVAGQVWIPDMWGQEDFLKDWIDCSAFDASLMPQGIMLARASLMEEGRRSTSNTLRVENTSC